MSLSVQTKTGIRNYTILMCRDQAQLGIDMMFDLRGAETFDPTEAVEAMVSSGEILTLAPGDELIFKLEP